jgi:N-hydroxyarylamine O-acetyltransferase
MDLDAYFRRIDYSGARELTVAVLDAVMRAHLAAIPFENLDQQLGRRVTRDLSSVFEKVVGRRRGGWCFEQNGLLGSALQTIGFDVTPVAGGVRRNLAGDGALGNHLALVVRLDGRPWLVDVGFGNSLARPIPLETGEHHHPPYRLRVYRTDDGYWRFEETAEGDPFSFDFRDEPADPAKLDWHQANFQDDPQSNFLLNLIAMRRAGATHRTLRGRLLTVRGEGEPRKRVLASADELVAVLRDDFGLDVPEIATRWPVIVERHGALFGEDA